MTTRSQYQRNAARRGLHQMSSENETPEALSFSPLKRLELETVELVRSIEAREHRMQQDKRQVLFNIYRIYTSTSLSWRRNTKEIWLSTLKKSFKCRIAKLRSVTPKSLR